MAELVFWCSVGLALYVYVGYPCALMLVTLVRSRSVKKAEKGSAAPLVSFIITAHNEERRIREKIENTLAQDYPARAFEIIVASDCSTDATDDVVRGYADRVRLIRAPERNGKEAAQQLAIAAASGHILIFSDVATAIAPDAACTNAIAPYSPSRERSAGSIESSEARHTELFGPDPNRE